MHFVSFFEFVEFDFRLIRVRFLSTLLVNKCQRCLLLILHQRYLSDHQEESDIDFYKFK